MVLDIENQTMMAGSSARIRIARRAFEQSKTRGSFGARRWEVGCEIVFVCTINFVPGKAERSHASRKGLGEKVEEFFI